MSFWKHKVEQVQGCALIFGIACVPVAIAGLMLGIVHIIFN